MVRNTIQKRLMNKRILINTFKNIFFEALYSLAKHSLQKIAVLSFLWVDKNYNFQFSST